MALISSIIKNSSKEVVVKVEGASGSATIALNSLASADQAFGASGATGYVTPTVNIATITSSGNLDSALVINRGASGATGYQTFAAAPENCPTVQFNQYGFTDNLQNTKDIVVTHSGAQATTYLVLHKVDGYLSKVEYEKYGSYDDETIVGAQNISGSPDYTG
jgi:hypothetical protein